MKSQSQRVYDPSREELYHVAPAPDPVTGAIGEGSTYNFSASAIAKIQIRYIGMPQDLKLEADLHLDAKGQQYLLMYCPGCLHCLTISIANKPFAHRPEVTPELGGELSTEEFSCTHDAQPGRKCGFRGVIEKNICRRT